MGEAWRALLKGEHIQSERKETMVDGDVGTQRCDHAYPIYYEMATALHSVCLLP